MKQLSLLLLICMISLAGSAQMVDASSADSVLLSGGAGTTELILENSTKNVSGGFLVNKAGGRTTFSKVLDKKNDSLYLVGPDTLALYKSGGFYLKNSSVSAQAASFHISGNGTLKTLTLTGSVVDDSAATEGSLGFNSGLGSGRGRLRTAGGWSSLVAEGDKSVDYIQNGTGLQTAGLSVEGTGLAGTSLKIGFSGGTQYKYKPSITINPSMTGSAGGVISMGTDAVQPTGRMLYADLSGSSPSSYGILKAEGSSAGIRDTLMNIDVNNPGYTYSMMGYRTKIYRVGLQGSGAGYSTVKTVGYSSDVDSYEGTAQAYYANALASAHSYGAAYAFYSDSGLVRIGRLATSLPAPDTVKAATRYVTTDTKGVLSFTAVSVPQVTQAPTQSTAGSEGDMLLRTSATPTDEKAYLKTLGGWKQLNLQGF